MITTITPSWEYEEHLYYSYTDYQGSLIALTDENGTVVERYAYDPWGARRNPDNWTLAATPPSGGWGALIVNRGYTGHEHLDAFGIINMNGRVYDPLTAMFFSPDPYVQAPGKWLNYNRYGYCFGNPLKYTDPSGEFFVLAAIYGLFCTEFGYDVQKYFSAIALHVDINANTHKQGIGLQASVGVPQMYGLSARAHGGIAYNWKNYDITPGWETNYGYELGVFGFVNVGETHFNSPGTKFDQTIAHATIGVPGLNIKYYNDWFFDSPLGDGGDRYRTGAGQITIVPIKVGYSMFTGDPGLKEGDRLKDDIGGKGGQYKRNLLGDDPDEFRAGVAYIGIGPFRFGKDSERIRHELQNVLIHDKLLASNPSPWFRPLWDRQDKWYWGFFGGGMLW